MQELLVERGVTNLSDNFDRYRVIASVRIGTKEGVCLMRMRDTNEKYWFLVADRIVRGNIWTVTNVLEFRHAGQRAEHEYTRRIT